MPYGLLSETRISLTYSLEYGFSLQLTCLGLQLDSCLMQHLLSQYWVHGVLLLCGIKQIGKAWLELGRSSVSGHLRTESLEQGEQFGELHLSPQYY